MRIYAAKICGDDITRLQDMYRLVDCERQKEILRLKKDSEKKRSLFAGLLLRYAFLNEGYSEKEWNRIRILKGEYGKPYIEGYSEFNYSLSHSGEWVICAVGTNEIGADIQKIKTWKIQMAKRFFHKEEYDRLVETGKSDEDMQTKEFYIMWAAKESAVKLNGRGIGAGISHYITNENYDCIYDEKENAHIDIKVYDEIEGYSVCVSSMAEIFPSSIEIVKFDTK